MDFQIRSYPEVPGVREVLRGTIEPTTMGKEVNEGTSVFLVQMVSPTDVTTGPLWSQHLPGGLTVTPLTFVPRGGSCSS